jgi:hypothetical protein
MGRNDRCPGSPRPAPRATICQKIDETAMRPLRAARAVCRNSAGRIARHLIIGAGLVITFWTFWAFSASAQARADASPLREPLPATTAPAWAHGRTPDHLADHRRVHRRIPPPQVRRFHTPDRAWPAPRHPRTARWAAPLPVAAPVHRLAARLPHLRLPQAGRLPVLRRLPRLAGAAQTIERHVDAEIPIVGDGDHGATSGSSGITQVAYLTVSGGACHRTGRPPHPAADRTAVTHPRRTAPATRCPAGHRVCEPRPYDAATTPVAGALGHVLTGTITHVPPRRVVRTVPGTPASAPVSGSGDSECSGGKTPTGASEDASWLSFGTPGLWSIAVQRTTRVGRYVADKPSFSPD